MASELVNVSDLGMKEEELFSRCDSNIDSEKITAPRYSYWHSVFRVFRFSPDMMHTQTCSTQPQSI